MKYLNKKIYFIIGVHLLLLLMYIAGKNLYWYWVEERSKTIYVEDIAAKDVSLTITYRDYAPSFEPTLLDASVKAYLHNVYEGFVSFDDSLNIVPQLAISWGVIHDTLWEFQLRPNVQFHSGDFFSADDVISTFDRVMAMPKSPLKDRLDSIQTVTKVDSTKIHIQTKYPDPLLLQKLTDLYILPKSLVAKEKDNEKIFDAPVGTGPYQFVKWEKKEYLQLKPFEKYYRGIPKYETVYIKSVSNKHARVGSVRTKETDILVDVPMSFLKQITERFGYKVFVMPKLESTFLLFNFKSKIFRAKEMRETIGYALDYNGLQKIIGDTGVRLSQFVPSGVFGYSPDINLIPYDIDKAKNLSQAYFSKENADSIEIELVLTADNEILGLWFKDQLQKIGIVAKLVLLTPEEVLTAMEEGKGDIFLVGWQFYDADANGLFRSLIHSAETVGENENIQYGLYNGIFYRNSTVDRLIEQAEYEIDPNRRLRMIQKVMAIALSEDCIGVPLFQTYQAYAVAPYLHFIPRIDSLVDIFSL